MTTLTLARSQSFAVPNRRSFAAHLPLAVWNVVLLAVVVAMGAWYLAQVNLTMSRGYELRDAESHMAELKTTARLNQIKLTEMEAVGNLTSQATALGMVPVGGVEYISKSNSGVALR